MATEDNSFYTPKEVEYLDKYGALSENLLDDEQIYELIIKHNFNDGKIAKEVDLAVKEIKSRGEEYMWGNVENGKKKIQKESNAEVGEKTEHKEKKQHKQHKQNNQHQTQKPYRQQKHREPNNQDQTGTYNEKDSQFRALHEENMINYNYYNRGSYGRGRPFRGRGNRNHYNNTEDYYNNQHQGHYNKRGRGGYNKNNQEKQTDSDIQWEYNDEGKLVMKQPNQHQTKHNEDNKEEDSHDVIIKEIAESQANMHKQTHTVSTVETKVKPQTPVKAKQPSPVKPKDKTPVKEIIPEVPKAEEKPKTTYITTSENDFHIKSVEDIKSQPQQKVLSNPQPTQTFDQFQGMQGGMPGAFPMFPPFPMFDPEMMKNMYSNMQMPNMQDPKNQMHNYYAMMNQMYMQQMMFYKNMMSQQMGGEVNEQFNNMMYGKK